MRCKASHLLALVLLVSPCIPTWAQFTEPVYSAPTPDVATLGTFGEIPVSLYTGTPDISVPLYEVTAGDFSYPISLSYHLASVKPNLPPGNYGLGWSLSTEACISRTVRGFPDEKKTSDGYEIGYYYNRYRMQGITPSSFDVLTSAGFSALTPTSGTYELSADEFSFSFNGYSGNFYLKPDGDWAVVSDQDVKVEFNPQTGFLSPVDLSGRIPKINYWTNKVNCSRWFGTFTLITPDGTRYTFGGADATDFSIDYYARNSSDLIATAWHLTQITTPQGRQINFSYASENRPIMLDIRYVTGSRTTYGVTPSSSDYLHSDIKGRKAYSGFLLFPARLESITSPNETVELTYAYDWNYGSRFFNDTPDVLYWETANQRGANIFHYDTGDPRFYFFELLPAEDAGSQQANRRAISECLHHDFLHRIAIRHTQEGDGQSVYFKYDGTWRKRLSALLWREGEPELEYEYRQVGNILYPILITPSDTSKTSLPRWRFHYNTVRTLPRNTVFPATDAWGYWEGFLKSPANSYLENDHPQPADVLSTVAETLRGITFPTGGSARFEYEGHRFSKIVPDGHGAPVDSSGSAGGLRLKTLTLADREGKVLSRKNYYYTTNLDSSTSSGVSSGNPAHRQTFILSGGTIGMNVESESGFPSSTTGMNTPPVGYSTVIEEIQDSTGTSLGLIKYRFSNYDTDIFGASHRDRPADYAYNVSGTHSHVPFTSNAAERGRLLSKEYYTSDNILERKETWRYERVRNDSLTTATQEVIIFCSDPQTFITASIGWLTQTLLFSFLPVEETVYEYTPSGTFVSSTFHSYNDSRLVVRDSTIRSDGTALVHHYTYPADYPLQYGWMLDRHVLSPTVGIQTVTSEGVHYQLAGYGSVQGPLGSPVPYVSNLTSGKEGGTLVRTHFQVFQSGSWGNPETILQDGLHNSVNWDVTGQRPLKTTSRDPAAVPQQSASPTPRTIPGSTMPLYQDQDGSQSRFYMYNGAHNLMYAFEPNGLATRFGYDAMDRLDAVMECDMSDGWVEDRTLQRFRYVYQQSPGVVLPGLFPDGQTMPNLFNPIPETPVLLPDGAEEVFPKKGEVYDVSLEYRNPDYHVDSLTNICRLTLEDTLQIRFSVRDLFYYRNHPPMDSLPPGPHPLVLRLFRNEPIGNENLLMEFPFEVDGRTLEVSVNRTLWPASDSVIVDLPPGWYNIKFLGIDTSSISAPPIIRGRSSVIMSDFPSFSLRLECLRQDEDNPELEPEPELVTSWNHVVTLSSQPGGFLDQQISLDWYDDFGRKESTQAIKASPSGKDLISLTESDPLGRMNKEWLSIPVPSTIRIPDNPENLQIDPLRDLQYEHILPEMLKGCSGNYYGETEHPFSEIIYGTSSLNRPGKSFGPGIQWHTNNKAVQTEYLTNTSSNSQLGCRRFTCTPHATQVWTISSPGFYAAGTLRVTRVTDEDGQVSITFEDRDGNTVLSRNLLTENNITRYLDTYYAYDSFGRLLAVLPPLASASVQNNGAISDTALQQYGYLYRYDDLGRIILKKLPGAGPIYYVYDDAQRIILTQDGKARTTGRTMFSIYDVFGRLCLTGTCSNTVTVGNPINTAVKAHYTGTGALGGYSVEGITLTNPQLLTVNWYDDYSFIEDVLGQPSAATDATLLYGTAAARTDALPTGTWAAVLDETGTVLQDAIWSVIRYDRRNRPAKTVSSDHLGGWTTEDAQYTFQGSPSVRHLVHHEASGRTRTEDYSYAYDNQERLLSVSHSLDGGTPVTLIENTYDDLGRLSSTGHASKTALEQTYSYNIRSQTTEIAGPLFSERLYYEQAPSASPLAVARYGGGISSMEWKAGAMSAFAGWDFSYDGIGRLTGSEYRLGSSHSGDYDTAYSYDDHGNILSIREEGLATPLRTFTYTGNHLFGRLYDANGNLLGSLQQEPLQINYNVLNLPKLILRIAGADTVRYAYAADGTKLCETVSKQGNLSSKSDYAANRIYRNGELGLLVTDGGYLAFPDSVAGTQTVPQHIFLLRDHLGSVRVVADTSGGVHQIHHYYPYGGDLLLDISEPQEPGIGIIGEDPGEPGIIEPEVPIIIDPDEPIVADPDEPYLVLETIPNNPFMFIGKERAGGRGLVFYDFGARFYLPGSPQWISMDPMAEKYYSISPYVYCAGDPINRIDIFGKEPIKRSAGTISGFIKFMNSIPTGIGSSMGIKAHDAMLRMGVFKGRKPANTAPFNNSNGNRYLYTKKGGWIDMSHFMFYAGRAYHYKQQKIKAQAIVNSKEFSFLSSEVQARLIYQAFINPAEEAVREGRLQEFSDLFFSPQSAYSYEDLPSDKFGADFGAFYFDPDSKKTFAEQLLDYLTDILNGTAPQNAPNYQDLPSDYPKKPSQRNRTTNPMYVQ